jgi:biopolymer transport protein ExbD
MARTRSIRNRKRRGSKKNFELDITSLLDILVILLIFLIKSYNSSGITMNIPEGIELPKSKSSSGNNPGVIIQVSKDKIWVDSKTVLDTANLPKALYDHGGRRIIPLFNELQRKKEEIKKLALQTNNKAKKFSGTANLIIDKSLKYKSLKRVMYTCATAGFKEYKFVVMGEEQ